MLRAFYSSATGMRAQELLIDNTANNIANVNTNGYKRSQLDFADLVYATSQSPGADIGEGQLTPIGLQIGSGVRPVGTTKVFSPGVLTQTGRSLDMAVEGEGFFEVNMPDGTKRYTRDGSFHVTANGQLVTSDGYAVESNFTLPENVAITDIEVSAQGVISTSARGTAEALGQISIFKFPNPAGLRNEGSNLYSLSASSGDPQTDTPGANGLGTIRSGFLEKSNVEIVTEMVSLITAQRAYEVNARAIRAGDEMLSNTAQIVR